MSRFTDRWQASGVWQVELGADAPWEATGTPGAFDWLVITPSWTADTGVDNLWSLSCYSGYVTGRERQVNGETVYTGPSLWALWGDPDGKGPWTNTDVAGDGTDFETDIWIAGTDGIFNTTDDYHNGLLPGDVVSTSFTHSTGIPPLRGTQVRKGWSTGFADQSNGDLKYGPLIGNALRWWLNYKSKWEWYWRINPDRTVDVGDKGDLWRSTPAAIIIPGDISAVEGNPSDPGTGLAVFGASDFSYEEDWSGWAYGAAVWYYDGSFSLDPSTTTSTYSGWPTFSFYGPDDSTTLKFWTMELAGDLVAGDPELSTQRSNLRSEGGPQYRVRASIEARPSLHTYMVPGDEVYVYADSVGVSGGSTQVQVRGEAINPLKYPLLEIDRPIQPEMGVYLIRNDPTDVPRVIDLTPWVLFDEGPAKVQLAPRERPKRDWDEVWLKITRKLNHYW